MKIATFNINNIKKRLPNLLRWLKQSKPDIACLQELKCETRDFPEADLRKAGYYAAWEGQKSWNGVAILSRRSPPVVTRRRLPGDPADRQARYIEAAIDEVFNGDEAAYDRQDPLKILETKKLPESAGVFAAGDDDEPFTSQMPNAVDAAEKAGMQVKSMVVPGGHDWDTWSTAFRDSLPFLTERMGLEAGHP